MRSFQIASEAGVITVVIRYSKVQQRISNSFVSAENVE
jgi:hypothetical protein